MPIEIRRNGTEPDCSAIVLGQLQRLDGAIEKEFTLIGDRMTWMVVSESFIFGAFVTAAVYYQPRRMALECLDISLLIVLPIVGFMIAAFAYWAIIAAHVASDRLKSTRKKLEEVCKDEVYVGLVSSDWATHPKGNVPSRYLPPMFMISWVFFLAVVVIELGATLTIRGLIASGLTIGLGIVLGIFHRSAKRTIEGWELRLREWVAGNSSATKVI